MKKDEKNVNETEEIKEEEIVLEDAESIDSSGESNESTECDVESESNDGPNIDIKTESEPDPDTLTSVESAKQYSFADKMLIGIFVCMIMLVILTAGILCDMSSVKSTLDTMNTRLRRIANSQPEAEDDDSVLAQQESDIDAIADRVVERLMERGYVIFSDGYYNFDPDDPSTQYYDDACDSSTCPAHSSEDIYGNDEVQSEYPAQEYGYEGEVYSNTDNAYASGNPVQMGVVVMDYIDQEGQPKGARVNDVRTGTGAYDAGLMIGDIIMEVDGQIVTSVDDLLAIMSTQQYGNQILVKVFRPSEGESIIVPVLLHERTEPVY